MSSRLKQNAGEIKFALISGFLMHKPLLTRCAFVLAVRKLIWTQFPSQCQFCGKRFVSAEFCHAHLERRHGEHGPFVLEHLPEPGQPPSVEVEAVSCVFAACWSG